MINGLIIMSQILFDNFGLAIIAFTVMVRLATLPLTLRGLRATRRMQALQPKVQELNKKHKDPKRRQEEMMKLYRSEGVNPLGCLGPQLIQMPIWFALYAVLTRTVGGTPERTMELAQRLYPWEIVQSAVPLATQFLWLDLGRPDTVMVVLVGITTWLQTKLSLSQTSMASAQTAQTNQMMLWMMPIMFAWFTLSVPSGLAVYWTATNIIGIVMNYFVYGWNDRPWTDIFTPSNSQSGPRQPKSSGSAALTNQPKRDTAAEETGDDERQSDAQSGNKRKERRRGGGQGAPATRPRPVPGRRRSR
ncbi:MAG: YidC/Oxa1 family membrane protein insertase [Dehalococcoidia bacterium]